jgi:hypothetical protein
MASWRAIAEPLRRCHRARLISATRSAGIQCRQRLGTELESIRAAAAPAMRLDNAGRGVSSHLGHA